VENTLKKKTTIVCTLQVQWVPSLTQQIDVCFLIPESV
jgi:hypothetical protein